MPISQNENNSNTITCVRCENTFEGFAPEQAYGCASDIHDDMIVGHFGSAVADMTQLKFRPGKRPADLENGQICDPCITTLMEEGVLEDGKSNVGSMDFSVPLGLTVLETFVGDDDGEDDGDAEIRRLFDEP